MVIRKSLYFFFISLVFCLVFVVTILDSAARLKQADKSRQSSILLVKELGLSDLALFTEASYMRHLALSDRHTAFKEHPVALDHFPTGSLAGPPRHLQP